MSWCFESIRPLPLISIISVRKSAIILKVFLCDKFSFRHVFKIDPSPHTHRLGSASSAYLVWKELPLLFTLLGQDVLCVFACLGF